MLQTESTSASVLCLSLPGPVLGGPRVLEYKDAEGGKGAEQFGSIGSHSTPPRAEESEDTADIEKIKKTEETKQNKNRTL